MGREKYPNLFSSINIKNVKIKNRIVMTTICTDFLNRYGDCTEQYKAFHAARAKGGTGLIIVGPFVITMGLKKAYYMPSPGLYDDSFMSGYAELVEVIHYFGAKIFAQFGSGLGRQGRTDKLEDKEVKLYSASPTAYHIAKEMIPESMAKEFSKRGLEFLKTTMDGPITRAATVEEIKHQEEAYGKAAERVVKMGFDGLEIYFGGGYFGFSFLSPRLNKREDEYGGSLENRMRYLMNAIRNVRKSVPDTFVVGIRVSIEEHMEGGLTREDTKAICKEAEAQGINYVSLEDGTWESMKYYLPEKPGTLVEAAAEIKKGLKIPVICGSMGDTDLVEEAIKQNKISMVGVGRPLIADPAWANKIAMGKKPVRCIRCNIGCWERLVEQSLPIRCTVNPECGYEQYNPSYKMSKPKKHFWTIGGATI